jgi:hypothetical protein
MTKRFILAIAMVLILPFASVAPAHAQWQIIFLEEGALARLLLGDAAAALVERGGAEMALGRAGAALGLEGRAAGAAAALSRGFTFATFPRVAGQRFVLVVNTTKVSFNALEASANMSVPVFFSNDWSARVPAHFAQSVNSNCPNGSATFTYLGHDAVNEHFNVSCGFS